MKLEQLDEARSTRGSFIRRAGMLLAAGVGAAMVRPATARAELGRCCPTNSCSGTSCNPPSRKFLCECPSGTWCICDTAAGCYPVGC
jgi:hypothetical protein